MKYSRQSIFRLSAILFFSLLASCATLEPHYFKLRFIDAQTARGIPLVEIESTNAVRYISDSAGWVAISPHDFGADLLYFSVSSPGYELKKDQYGYRGILIRPIAGQRRTVKLQRINIAERLYRITGEGIYRDSKMLGIARAESLPDQSQGGVFGQDSVVNAIYDGKLRWFWGDTKRADGPLGNFKVSGAVSSLEWTPQNNPPNGVDLTYFVDERGFARAMSPIPGDGMVWISGLMVFEEDGREKMLTQFSRMEDLGVRHELGIAVWNDETETFDKRVAFPDDAPLYPRGHALKLDYAGEKWFYFGRAFPNVRVRAAEQDILNPKRYQAYTCLIEGSRWQKDAPPLERDQNGQLVWGWKEDTDIVTETRWHSMTMKGLVKPEEKRWPLIDIETGHQIFPHAGHVTWNRYRNRWIAIFNQDFGHSVLGEVWYAEAFSPMGPWSAVRKIVTHDRYSFYNVKQHPYFAHGPYLYFEGTYTKTFSGNDRPTPRYDYNQVMYRLNLDDPRLPRLEK
jgi:hypothetical protein